MSILYFVNDHSDEPMQAKLIKYLDRVSKGSPITVADCFGKQQTTTSETLSPEDMQDAAEYKRFLEEEGFNPAPFQWPAVRDVTRHGDMAPKGQMQLRVMLDGDNDVIVAITENRMGSFQSASAEFCTSGMGGGRSPKTREALINLIRAMHEDNQNSPQ